MDKTTYCDRHELDSARFIYHLVGGLEHFLFFHILEIVTPTDFHIFQRDSVTTNQYMVYLSTEIITHLWCLGYDFYMPWSRWDTWSPGMDDPKRSHLDLEALEPICETPPGDRHIWENPWKTTHPHFAWLGLVASCSKWFAFFVSWDDPKSYNQCCG